MDTSKLSDAFELANARLHRARSIVDKIDENWLKLFEGWQVKFRRCREPHGLVMEWAPISVPPFEMFLSEALHHVGSALDNSINACAPKDCRLHPHLKMPRSLIADDFQNEVCKLGEFLPSSVLDVLSESAVHTGGTGHSIWAVIQYLNEDKHRGINKLDATLRFRVRRRGEPFDEVVGPYQIPLSDLRSGHTAEDRFDHVIVGAAEFVTIETVGLSFNVFSVSGQFTQVALATTKVLRALTDVIRAEKAFDREGGPSAGESKRILEAQRRFQALYVTTHFDFAGHAPALVRLAIDQAEHVVKRLASVAPPDEPPSTRHDWYVGATVASGGGGQRI